MSARQPLDPERARLRRIGFGIILGGVLLFVVVTVLLVSSNDSRDAVLVDARDINVSGISEGDVVRVTGVTERLFDDDDFEDVNQLNAIKASQVTEISADQAASATGAVALDELLDDDTQGRRVSVVGEVLDETDRGVLAIGTLED